MKKNLKLLFEYIVKFHRKHFYILVAILLSSVILEISSLAILALMLSLLTNPNIINEYTYLEFLFNFFNFESDQKFILIFLTIGIFLIILSSLISLINLVLTSKFSMRIGVEMGQRLFNLYVDKNIMWHNKNNSSSLINKIIIECHRITMNILNPLSQFLYKFFLSISIIVFLLLFNFKITFLMIFSIISFYLFIFSFLRKKNKDKWKKYYDC